MSLIQVFIDCMPGPTNHFGGHSDGNIASMASKNSVLNPKKAALQWLEKIKKVHELGGIQLVLPPHPRPLKIYKENVFKLAHYSSAFMWMANAGHFIPKSDSFNNYNQFTPANMKLTAHRKYEHYFNRFWLKQIFPEWIISKPLLDSDEGAANSIRLWNKDYESGLYLFIYGSGKTTFPSRQHKNSFNDLIKQCKIKHSLIIQQNDKAINKGVFHNDVISFGFENTLICHQYAFKNQPETLNKIEDEYKKITKENLNIFEVSEKDLPLKDAINSYIFNSQAFKTYNGWGLLCPQKAYQCQKSKTIIKLWKTQGIFKAIEYTDVSSSLKNGGGPACLRLTIYLTKNKFKNINQQFKFDLKMYKVLKTFIKTTYPSKCIKQNKGKTN